MIVERVGEINLGGVVWEKKCIALRTGIFYNCSIQNAKATQRLIDDRVA